MIGESMESDCIFSMAIALAEESGTYVPPNTVGELLSEELLEALPLCAGGEAGCTEGAQLLLEQRFVRSFIPSSPEGAAILMIAAEDDTIHSASAHACAYDEAAASGVELSRCFVANTNHFNIVSAGIAAALAWVENSELRCPEEAAPPACD